MLSEGEKKEEELISCLVQDITKAFRCWHSSIVFQISQAVR